ncbi:MAG: insulinase family protein [Nitrospirae bacterium]|nr:insulinase family protein [Nitrospirota bacterium]
MRHPHRPSALLALLFAALLSACAALPDPRTMTFDPVEITEPPIDVVTLDNGMTLYLLPDRDLPRIHIGALIQAGAVYAGPGGQEVAAFTGALLRTGGAGDLGPDALDEALQFAAIEMGSAVGDDNATATLDTLTRTFPEALGHFADMLRRPRFDAERLEARKAAAIEDIRRRNDNPAQISRRAFAKLLYGADHPYAWFPEEADVEAVTRERLTAFHQGFFHPSRTRLAIVGDFDRDAMVVAIEAAFGDWRTTPEPLPEPPRLPTEDVGQVAFTHRDVTQVSVRVGQLSIDRYHPDYFALALANRILGGDSFRSRLFNVVRTRHGLAYSVGSAYTPGHLDRGTFLMAVRTRPDQVGQALHLMLEEVRRLRTEPVPEAELAAAKEAFLNAFVFTSDTPGEVVNRRMYLDYWGLPADELQNIKTRTLAVTADDMLRVARAHLVPERMAIHAVGDREQLKAALAPFGTPQEIPLDD